MEEHRPKRKTNGFYNSLFLLVAFGTFVVNGSHHHHHHHHHSPPLSTPSGLGETDKIAPIEVKTLKLEKVHTNLDEELVVLNSFIIDHLSISHVVTLAPNIRLYKPIIPEHVAQHISHLRLDGNKILTISQGFFKAFTNLTSLSLTNNKLCDLPVSFRTYIPAPTIYLNYNELIQVQRISFNKDQTISYLNLDYNKLQVLELEENFVKERISVRGNKDLVCVSDDAFGEAKFIDISGTKIDRFNFLDVERYPKGVTLLAEGNENIKCDCPLMELMVGVNPVFQEIKGECVWDDKEPPYVLEESSKGHKQGKDALIKRWETEGCRGVAAPPNKTESFCGEMLRCAPYNN